MPTTKNANVTRPYAPLDALLADSDWVSLQLPATDATRNIIGRKELATMKRGAFLINVSRAALVDRDALIEALKSGHLGGFALDPLYEEPGRADDELLGVRKRDPHSAHRRPAAFQCIERFPRTDRGL